MRKFAINLTEHDVFKNFIIAILLTNAVTIGLETSKNLESHIHEMLALIDKSILVILVIEVSLRVFAGGLRFFLKPWNIFDFIITILSLIPSSGSFAVLRAFRILRVMRLFSYMPRLKRVVNTIVSSIPGILSVVFVMMVLFYIFSVIGTNLFSQNFHELFGDIGKSMFTLFQIMTLESWASQIARPVMKTHPNSWIYFVSFILMTTFTVLNLVIAVLINSMQAENKKRRSTDELDFNPEPLRQETNE